MKSLERPSGYFQTWDPKTGKRIEGETRQCVHCGFMWVYNPKESFDKKLTGEYKPIIRGKCFRCFGLVCARDECLKKGCIPQMKQIEDIEKAGRQNAILLG